MMKLLRLSITSHLGPVEELLSIFYHRQNDHGSKPLPTMDRRVIRRPRSVINGRSDPMRVIRNVLGIARLGVEGWGGIMIG